MRKKLFAILICVSMVSCICGVTPQPVLAESLGAKGTWSHGGVNIRGMAASSNGDVLMVVYGGYQTLKPNNTLGAAVSGWPDTEKDGGYRMAAAAHPSGKFLLGTAGGYYASCTSPGIAYKGVWVWGAKNIHAIAVRPNGSSVFAGVYGYWQIMHSNLQMTDISGQNALGGGYDIYTASARSNNSVVLAGSNGKWRILTSGNILSRTPGTWVHGSNYDIYASAVRPDGTTVLAGEGGKWQVLNANNTLGASGTLPGSFTVYAAGVRPDGSVVLAGNGGNWQILNPDNTYGSGGTWKQGGTIYSVAVRPDGSTVLAGSSGKWEILLPDSGYEITTTPKVDGFDFTVKWNGQNVSRGRVIVLRGGVAHASANIEDGAASIGGLAKNTRYNIDVYINSFFGYVLSFSEYTAAAVPSGLSGTSTAQDRIRLSWNKNGNPSGTTYELYCNTTGKTIYTGTATTYTHTGLTPDTTYSYKVCAKNGDGVYTDYTDSISVTTLWDSVPPEIVSLEIGSVVRSLTPKITITACDNISGIDKYLVSYDNFVTCEEVEPTREMKGRLEVAETVTLPEIPAGEGKKTVYIKPVDGAGNVGAVKSAEFNYSANDMEPNVIFSINNGAEVTESRTVSITIEAIDDISTPDKLRYRISLDGQNWKIHDGELWVSADTEWGTYLPITKSGFDIGAAGGIKHIFVQVQDENGNTTTAMQKIIHVTDETRSIIDPDFYNPYQTLTVTSPEDEENLEGHIISTGGVNMQVLQRKVVTLELMGLAGRAAELLTSFDGINWGTAEKIPAGADSFTKNMSFPSEGKQAVFIKFRNPDGAESQVFRRNYLVDYTAPVISARTVSGAGSTSDSTIRLLIGATDNVSSRLKYSINGSWYSVIPADGIVTHTLSAAEMNTLVIKVIDEAGNVAQGSLTVWRL